MLISFSPYLVFHCSNVYFESSYGLGLTPTQNFVINDKLKSSKVAPLWWHLGWGFFNGDQFFPYLKFYWDGSLFIAGYLYLLSSNYFDVCRINTYFSSLCCVFLDLTIQYSTQLINQNWKAKTFYLNFRRQYGKKSKSMGNVSHENKQRNLSSWPRAKAFRFVFSLLF